MGRKKITFDDIHDLLIRNGWKIYDHGEEEESVGYRAYSTPTIARGFNCQIKISIHEEEFPSNIKREFIWYACGGIYNHEKHQYVYAKRIKEGVTYKSFKKFIEGWAPAVPVATWRGRTIRGFKKRGYL